MNKFWETLTNKWLPILGIYALKKTVDPNTPWKDSRTELQQAAITTALDQAADQTLKTKPKKPKK